MNRDDRWQYLVNVSFALGDRAEHARRQGASDTEAATRSFLDGILEVFPESIDPVEDFEGYAVRRMALALRESLRR